jgi:hypothetical protein
MIKNILFVLLLGILFSSSTLSQNTNFKLKKPELKLKESAGLNTDKLLYKKSDMPTPLLVIGIISLISPVVVFEDKKVFFALTKEVSIGKLHFGRLSFEYSYVFRSYNQSHIRLSYNYDIVLESSDFAAIIASPGVGYFTDTHNKGWFMQASAGILLPFSEFITYHPYFRYRHTFIENRFKSDINDISIGMAFILYL